MCSSWIIIVPGLITSQSQSLLKSIFSNQNSICSVGFANYGHFIRFLLAVDIACCYHLYLISTRTFGQYAYHVSLFSLSAVLLMTSIMIDRTNWCTNRCSHPQLYLCCTYSFTGRRILNLSFILLGYEYDHY